MLLGCDKAVKSAREFTDVSGEPAAVGRLLLNVGRILPDYTTAHPTR
jgi:hypothetical protein